MCVIIFVVMKCKIFVSFRELDLHSFVSFSALFDCIATLPPPHEKVTAYSASAWRVFLFFGKQKLQTSFKLKYGSFTWGDTPKGALLDGWFGVRS